MCYIWVWKMRDLVSVLYLTCGYSVTGWNQKPQARCLHFQCINILPVQMSYADIHKRLSNQHHSCSQEGAAEVISRKELVHGAVRWHLNIYIYNKGLFPLDLSAPSISTLPCLIRRKCPLWFCLLSSLKSDHRLLTHRYIYLIQVYIKPLSFQNYLNPGISFHKELLRLLECQYFWQSSTYDIDMEESATSATCD